MAVAPRSMFHPAPEPTARDAWLPWGGAMAAVYLLCTFAGWGRTLLEDEIWSLYNSERSLLWLLRYIRGDLVHPPLWYVLASGWPRLFGLSDGAAKALPLVFNLPALLLFPLLARRFTEHWRLATLLFAALYWRIGGVMGLVRMYGLLLLLVVVALLLWERWRRAPGIGVLTAWGSVMLLMVYTHYSGVLLLGAFVVVEWLCGPRPASARWGMLFVAGLVGLSLVPWLLYVWPVYQARGLEPNLAWVRSPHQVLGQLPFFFLSYIHPGFSPFDDLRELPPLWIRIAVYAIAIGLHLVLVVLAWRGRRLAETNGFRGELGPLAGLVLLPIAVVYLFSLIVHPALDARFLLGLLPAYWLLMVRAGESAGEAGRWLLFGVLLPWVLLSVAVTLPEAGPAPVRRAVDAVAAEYQPGDLLLAECRVGVNVWWEWTHRLGRLEQMQAFGCERWRWWLPGVATPREAELADLQARRVWLIYVQPAERQRLEARLLGQGFLPVQRSGPRFVALYASTEASVSTSWTMGRRRSRPD
ncbi:MAG: hypothetical protein K6U02_05910 [Firmicutes bacterium]|nr:hypothetical protein [Bacillota bacterium]